MTILTNPTDPNPPLPPPTPPAAPLSLTFPAATFAKLSPHPFLLAHLSSTAPASTSTTAPGQTSTLIPRRPNGRQPSQFRVPHLNTGSLSHAQGSALVRYGDTTAVAGVRAEILLVSDITSTAYDHRQRQRQRQHHQREHGDSDDDGAKELQALDLLVPNVELATGCAPQFMPGQPPSGLAQGLSTRVYTMLHASRLVDVGVLRIWGPGGADDEGVRAGEGEDGKGGVEGGDDVEMEDDDGDEDDDGSAIAATRDRKAVVKAYWTLHIDILFISLDGNPFDAAWAATVAALRDVRLPRARWDADAEMVLCFSDEVSGSGSRVLSLGLRGLPVACTFGVFAAAVVAGKAVAGAVKGARGRDGGDRKDGKRQWILADPDNFEEGLCEESVTVVLDCSQGSDHGHGPGPRRGTRVSGISKVGGTSIGRTEMRELVGISEKRWAEWKAAIATSKAQT